MTPEEYIYEIVKLLRDCDDVSLLDFVLRLVQKSI